VLKKSSTEFTLLVASADTRPTAQAVYELEVERAKVKLTVEYGDFSEPLQKAVDALREVRPK
jgi:dipeptidyl-peptidase III